MKNLSKTIVLLLLMMTVTNAKMFIGEITSTDHSFPEEELKVLNSIFKDIWTENCAFKIIKNPPAGDFSEFCQTLQMVENDKFVTGKILIFNNEKHLRMDIYNHEGVREHVSRVILGGSDTYTEIMLTEREYYYSPTAKESVISSSGKHHLGWGLNIGSGIRPTGFSYVVTTESGLDSTISPANLAITDIMITDLIGVNRDILLTSWIHYNWRAAIGIGVGFKKAFVKRKSWSPTLGVDVGLNKQIIQKVMGKEEANYVGSRDGLMVQGKVGMIFLRDMKRNLYFDVAYTRILSEKEAGYPSVQFGMISTWKHKKNKKK